MEDPDLGKNPKLQWARNFFKEEEGSRGLSLNFQSLLFWGRLTISSGSVWLLTFNCRAHREVHNQAFFYMLFANYFINNQLLASLSFLKSSRYVPTEPIFNARGFKAEPRLIRALIYSPSQTLFGGWNDTTSNFANWPNYLESTNAESDSCWKGNQTWGKLDLKKHKLKQQQSLEVTI